MYLFRKVINEEEELICLTQNTEIFTYTHETFSCFHYLEKKVKLFILFNLLKYLRYGVTLVHF